MTRAAIVLVLCVGAAATDARAADWVGTFRLPASADPVDILVDLDGSRATLSMGYGHPARNVVTATVRGTRVRFTMPGGVAFDGRRRGRALSGTVSQGALRGTFRLAPGSSPTLPLYGLYRSAAGEAVTVVRARGFTPWLVELPSGRVHGIGPRLTVGALLGDTSGNGSIAVGANGLTWQGRFYKRVPLRQREVRVGANAATLTLPPGTGPFPAVVMVHGSGANTREEFQAFAAYCASLGVAVLADDKRGVGQSTGRYPGEAATSSTLDALARDAQTEVRYLAALPQIDRARIGLLGDSQAGWIVALAAAREPLIRWAVPLVGPTVTVGETDRWGSLAGKSQSQPSGTKADMIQQVHALGPSGFDPRPYLAKLAIPVFWVFGDDDRNVPTELCVDALRSLKNGRDFTWTVLPMQHALLVLPNGLYDSLPRSPGFAPGLYPAIGDWLRARRLVG